MKNKAPGLPPRINTRRLTRVRTRVMMRIEPHIIAAYEQIEAGIRAIEAAPNAERMAQEAIDAARGRR